jgi:uncharacterized protein DUF3291
MSTPHFQIAQLNVARLRAPLDDPSMREFVELLAPVNAIADASPGFVWRLQTEAGDATAIQAFDDLSILVNMSVWESIDALRAFAYSGAHLDVFRARRRWFDPMEPISHVLWWVPAGHVPTVEEGRSRLERLHADGPTPEAFSFKRTFPPPAEAGATP